jgi:hypothetical protein
MRALPLHLVALPVLLAACSEYDYADLTRRDSFWQPGESVPVDVLFVVDDSASMDEEQTQLAASFDGFTLVLEQSYADFRLGVVTTDPDQPATFTGPVLTPDTADLAGSFAAAVAVGTSGSRDEQGLARALSAANQAINPDFLRADAQLAVVVFSDEDDHSPETVDWYLHELTVLAGSPGLAVHAIVGDMPAGCVSGISAADPGERYLTAADTTGGLSGSICASDYTDLLTRVAFDITGWNDTFLLTELPEPETLRVWVDSVAIPARDEDGWTYSLGDNAVVFHDRAVPRPGMEVVVEYEIAEGNTSSSAGADTGR